MTSFTRLTKSALSWFILASAARSSFRNGGGGSKIHSFLNTRAVLSPAAEAFFFAAFFLVAILVSSSRNSLEAGEAHKRITARIYSLNNSPRKEWRLIYTEQHTSPTENLQSKCCYFLATVGPVRHSLSCTCF